MKNNFLLIGSNYRVSSSLTLQPVPKSRQRGSSTFRHSFIVYADGQEIGTLLTDPQGVHAEHAGLVSFTFANWLFYTQEGWYHYWNQLKEVLQLRIQCITYCEIALDFNANLLLQLDGIYHSSNLAKRRDAAPRYKAVLPKLTAKPDGHGGYIFGKSARGPRGNGKQVVGYDKSTEIAEKGKSYIKEWHELNGLDTSRTVERWEARLANQWLRLYNVTIEDLNNPNKLFEIYAHAMRDVLAFYDFTQPFRDKHRNLKHTKVCLLDVTELTPQRLEKIVRGVQEDPRKLKKRGALREAVHSWLESGSETTANYIREFIQQLPPKGHTWPLLIERYVLDYVGNPFATVVERMGNVGKLYQAEPCGIVFP